MTLNWTNQDVDIIEAVLSGAASGFAFRTLELAGICEEAHDLLVPDIERARDYAKTKLGELMDCSGRCWACLHCIKCPLGASLAPRYRDYQIERTKHTRSREARRQARYDLTRLHTFMEARRNKASMHSDNKRYLRTLASGQNIIGYWAQWARFHIKRF